FEHCLFRGEETAFHGSDVSGAEFTPDSGLDCSEGNWKRIETWEGFVEELTRRGALHADRAYAFGCKPPPPRPAQVAPPPPKGLWNRLLQLFGRS
ncbi:MAG: hypothetical protein KDK78_00115, partial [Chlamydiia bacterium]|nr:hypothetical protein [Chlamydiia bacterium]